MSKICQMTFHDLSNNLELPIDQSKLSTNHELSINLVKTLQTVKKLPEFPNFHLSPINLFFPTLQHTGQQNVDTGEGLALITLFKNEPSRFTIQRFVDFIQQIVIRARKALLHPATAVPTFFQLIIPFRLMPQKFFWSKLFWLFRQQCFLLLLRLLLLFFV
jgi:hypothetical protein